MNEAEVRALHSRVRAIHKLGRAATPPIAGVTPVSARTLGVVGRCSRADGIRPGEIADELGMTSSNVAAALRELEAAGYVRRTRALDDGRHVLVRLTELGGATVQRVRALRVDALREAIETTLEPDEQERLAAVIPLLERVAAGYPTAPASAR